MPFPSYLCPTSDSHRVGKSEIATAQGWRERRCYLVPYYTIDRTKARYEQVREPRGGVWMLIPHLRLPLPAAPHLSRVGGAIVAIPVRVDHGVAGNCGAWVHP